MHSGAAGSVGNAVSIVDQSITGTTIDQSNLLTFRTAKSPACSMHIPRPCGEITPTSGPNGYWRFADNEVILEATRALHLLTHPDWWTWMRCLHPNASIGRSRRRAPRGL